MLSQGLRNRFICVIFLGLSIISASTRVFGADLEKCQPLLTKADVYAEAYKRIRAAGIDIDQAGNSTYVANVAELKPLPDDPFIPVVLDKIKSASMRFFARYVYRPTLEYSKGV